MITKWVNTLYKGLVGLPFHHVEQAIAAGETLGIWHGNAFMELSIDDMIEKRVSISDIKYKDKFGGDDYYLCYYAFKPTMVQAKLFEGVAYGE